MLGVITKLAGGAANSVPTPGCLPRVYAGGSDTAMPPRIGRVDDAISLDFTRQHDRKYLHARCDIAACIGEQVYMLRFGFNWNGADIPRWIEWLVCLLCGLSRFDPRLAIATGFHDDLCAKANAGNGLRAIADAVFITLLMPIEFNDHRLTGIGKWRAVVLYLGVRSYSIYRFAKMIVRREAPLLMADIVVFVAICVLSYLSWRLWL